MPYKKNYKRRNYKRKKYVPGWGGSIGRVAGLAQSYASKGGIAYKALGLARKVADAVNTEYKQHHVQLAPAVPNTGGLQDLSLIPQGVGDFQRVGSSLKQQNVTIRGRVVRTSTDCQVRVILVWDKQNDIASAADLLESTGSAYAPFSPKNQNNKFRSKILWDKTFSVDTYNPIRLFDMSIPLNKHTEYDGSTTNIRTGSLKLVYVSTEAAGLPVILFMSHLTYTDN